MAISTTPWDSAAHLKTEEDIQLYLEAYLEEAEDDPTAIIHALAVIARARSMNRVGQDCTSTPEGLDPKLALSLDEDPTFVTVAKIARSLGFKLTIQPAVGK